MKRSTMRNRRSPDREFDGFNDPLVRIIGGIGIALMLMIVIAAFLKSLEILQFSLWLLLAYAVVGAICGFVRSRQYGAANRNRNAPSV